MRKETIYIGNDHGGVDHKREFIKILREKGYEVVNVGSDEGQIVRYPYFAAKVAEAVKNGKADRGILICSTGIGMSIIANKYKGVRASNCCSTYTARMTREHNDSNLLCLGGKTVGLFEAIDMLEVWLNTEYIGGRHDISLGLIQEAEETLCTGDDWHPKDKNL